MGKVFLKIWKKKMIIKVDQLWMEECEIQIEKNLSSILEEEKKRSDRVNFVSFGDDTIDMLVNQNNEGRFPKKISFGSGQGKGFQKPSEKGNFKAIETNKSVHWNEYMNEDNMFLERDTVKNSNDKEWLKDLKEKNNTFLNLKIINNIADEIEKEIIIEGENKKTLERFKNIKKGQEDLKESKEKITFFEDPKLNIDEIGKKKIQKLMKVLSNSVNKTSSNSKRWSSKKSKNLKTNLNLSNSKKSEKVIQLIWNKNNSIKRKNIKSNNLFLNQSHSNTNSSKDKNKIKDSKKNKNDSQQLGWTYSNIFNKHDQVSTPNSKSFSSGNSEIANPMFYQRIKSNFQTKKKNGKSNLSSFSEKFKSVRSVKLDSDSSVDAKADKETSSKKKRKNQHKQNIYFKFKTLKSKKNVSFQDKLHRRPASKFKTTAEKSN